ncbi:MAG: protein translocase subunit SecD [Candidatus Shapirobacteria bacterium]
MRRNLLVFIIALTVVAAYIDLPARPALSFNLGKWSFNRDLEIKKGIDLAGGTHLVFEAQMQEVAEKDRQTALESARENISRRVNLFGLSEVNVQTSRAGENYRLIVELPGVKEVDQAIEMIGQTAQLRFWEYADPASPSAGFKPTDLTGKDLEKSQVQFDNNTGKPVVGLRFTGDGAKKFAEITERNVGQPVAIFLDDEALTIPRVEEAITAGEAVINGDFTTESAKKLAVQLNAGALPVPIKVMEQRTVGASLGEESVAKSIRAGLIGLGMVAFFMAAYYGGLGILADVGLVIYGLLTLAIYKLVPITLTLPGIAGFLLSVGMAVDANILIFERMKEEVRAGREKKLAMELGFGRAWDSIRDANVCTIITSLVLLNPFSWNFLNTSGMVRGFALTLLMGVLLSLFTGIVVTRTILRVFVKGGKK